MNPISLYHLQQGIARTIVGGRLDRESDTELRWNAYENYSIGLYNGESWEIVTPSGIVQAFNDATTISGSTLTYDTNYDVYAKYISQDNFSLEFQEWAGNTSRYEDPQRFEGIQVRDLTEDGKQYRWLGIVRLDNDSGVKFTNSVTQRFIMNNYNKINKDLYLVFGSNFNPPVAETWYRWNNDDSNKIYFLSDGISMTRLTCSICFRCNAVSAAYGVAAIAVDSNTTPYTKSNWTEGGGGNTYIRYSTEVVCRDVFLSGYHEAVPLVKGSLTSDILFLGNYSDTANWRKPQIAGEIWC